MKFENEGHLTVFPFPEYQLIAAIIHIFAPKIWFQKQHCVYGAMSSLDSFNIGTPRQFKFTLKQKCYLAQILSKSFQSYCWVEPFFVVIIISGQENNHISVAVVFVEKTPFYETWKRRPSKIQIWKKANRDGFIFLYFKFVPLSKTDNCAISTLSLNIVYNNMNEFLPKFMS